MLGQDGADEADDAGAVGEDPDDVGTATDLAVEALVGVVRPDLSPDLLREGGDGEDVRRASWMCSAATARDGSHSFLSGTPRPTDIPFVLVSAAVLRRLPQAIVWGYSP